MKPAVSSFTPHADRVGGSQVVGTPWCQATLILSLSQSIPGVTACANNVLTP